MGFGPSRERTSRRQRLALFVLRAAVIALVLLAMLRPTLVYTRTNKQPATLVVLVDCDAEHDGARRGGQDDALGGAARPSPAAAPALATAVAGVRAEGVPVRRRPARASGRSRQDRGSPTSPRATRRPSARPSTTCCAARRASGCLGVILLSDGAQQAYAPRDLPPQTAAARVQHLGYTLFTFPFGQSRGLGEAKDVAVKDLIVNPTVFVKNELTISGQVRVDGYVNVEIPIRLLFETAPGKMEVVAQQTIKATADGQLVPVQMSYVPQVPGEHKLTLEAVEQPGELVTTNNELSTFVNVLERRAERALHRGRAAGGDEVSPPRAGFLAGHQGRLRAARRGRPAVAPGRLRRPLPAGQVRRLYPGRRRFDGLSRRRADPAEPVRQPRGGADHARRLPDLRSRRLRRDAAGQGAAGGHGPVRAAAARRAVAHRSALARPAADAAHRRWASGTSP